MPSKPQPARPLLQLEPSTRVPRKVFGCYDEDNPCDVLLDDPALFFSPKYKRPRHLCERVMSANLIFWVGHRDNELGRWLVTEDVLLTRLPVGSRSMAFGPQSVFGRPLPAAFDEQRLRRSLETLPDKYASASLIVQHWFDGVALELYFMVSHDLDGAVGDVFDLDRAPSAPLYSLHPIYPSGVRYRINGIGSQLARKESRDKAEAMVTAAVEWWEVTMAGQRLDRRGRPKGSLGWPLAEVEALRDECRAEPGHDDYTVEDFIRWLDLVRPTKPNGVPSKNTVEDRVADTGLGWRLWWDGPGPN